MQKPVYLVSLQKDEARRQELKKRFLSYENFNMIEAVDGRNLSAKDYFGYALPSFKEHKRLLSPAELGCALSHMKAYEEFLASDFKHALFIEDDVIGDDGCIEFALKTAENLPENAVFICGCQDGLAARFSAFARRVKNEASPKPKPLKDKDRTLFLVSPHSYGCICSTAAYVLSRHSAQRLLDMQKNIVSTSDLWDYLLKKGGLEMYFCDIFAHPTDMTGSNINAERDMRGYDGFSARGLLNSLRYIALTRTQALFCGYERIFKRGKNG